MAGSAAGRAALFQVAAPEAAEDLAADTWVAVIGGLGRFRGVVALQVVGGLEVAEVARIVGKRPGAVWVLAHRGLWRLAKQLEAAGLAGV